MFEVGDPLILFADLLIPFGDCALVLRRFLTYLVVLLVELVVRSAERVVRSSKPVVFDKQVAEQTENPLLRPDVQPGDRSPRVLPPPVCLADMHPPYASKNETICPAKSSGAAELLLAILEIRN